MVEDEADGKAVDVVTMLKRNCIRKLKNPKSNVSTVMYTAIMPRNVTTKERTCKFHRETG